MARLTLGLGLGLGLGLLLAGCGKGEWTGGPLQLAREGEGDPGRQLGSWAPATLGLPAGARVVGLAHLDGSAFALVDSGEGRNLFALEEGASGWSPHGPPPRGGEILQAVVRADRSLFLTAGDVSTGQGSLYRLDFADEPWLRLDSAPEGAFSATVKRGSELLVAVSQGPLPGLHASADRGRTWRLRASPSGTGAFLGSPVAALVAAPGSQRLFAAGDPASGFAGLATSDDGGATWERETEIEGAVRGLHAWDVLVLADLEGSGPRRSDNFGNTWHPMTLGSGVRANGFQVSSLDFAFAGTTEGVRYSRDGGRTWEPAGGGPVQGLSIDVLYLAGSSLLAASGAQVFAAPLE